MSDRTVQGYGMSFGCVFILWHVLENEVKNNNPGLIFSVIVRKFRKLKMATHRFFIKKSITSQ